MNYFLDFDFNPNSPLLSEEEAHHATKALRLKEGDEVCVGNGKGSRFTGHLLSKGKFDWEVVIKKVEVRELPKPLLTMAIAPTKNPSRFEWFVEKATEIGVNRIIPLETKRTERHRLKRARVERIIHAASKQSLRWFSPVIDELTHIENLSFTEHDEVYIAHCESGRAKLSIPELLSAKPQDSKTIAILVGPEGDFTLEEIDAVVKKGAIGIDLGENRLRTETAGVFASSLLALKKQYSELRTE